SELQLEDEEDSHRLRRTSSASSSSSQSTTVIPTPLSPHPTSFDATTLLHFGWGNQELRRGDSLKFCLMWDILVGLTINENVAELNLVHTQIKKFSVDPNVDVYEETMRFLTDPSDNICQNVLKWIGGRVISLRITLIDVIGGWSLVSSSLNYHQTTLLRRLHLIDIEPHEFDKLLRNRLVKQLHTLLIDVTNSSPFNYQGWHFPVIVTVTGNRNLLPVTVTEIRYLLPVTDSKRSSQMSINPVDLFPHTDELILSDTHNNTLADLCNCKSSISSWSLLTKILIDECNVVTGDKLEAILQMAYNVHTLHIDSFNGILSRAIFGAHENLRTHVSGQRKRSNILVDISHREEQRCLNMEQYERQ
ncbi:unnamed protein product, partial [Didymodactylos carnosus]